MSKTSLLRATRWEGNYGRAELITPRVPRDRPCWLITPHDAVTAGWRSLQVEEFLLKPSAGYYVASYKTQTKRGVPTSENQPRWLIGYPPRAILEVGEGTERTLRALTSLLARAVAEGNVRAELDEPREAIFLALLKLALS